MRKVSLSLLFSLGFLFSYAQTTVVYDFKNPSSPTCGDWPQNDILYIGCAPFMDPSSGSFLGEQLTFIYTGLGDITNVEVDLIDYCGAGCTLASVNSGPNAIQTQNGNGPYVFANLGGLGIDQVVVQSFEAFIEEVRFTIDEGDPGIPAELIVNDNPILSETYIACDLVYSTGTVDISGAVDFVSGETIFLDNGFTVEEGGEFSAEIEDCIAP